MEFGQNGVRLDLLSDQQLEYETRNRKLEYSSFSAIVFLFVSGQILGIQFVHPEMFEDKFSLSLFLAMALIAVIPGIVGFAQKAVDSDKLPHKPGEEPRYDHISSTGVVLAVFALFLVISAARFFGDHYGKLIIGDGIGLIVIAVVFSTFLLLIFAPRISNLRRIASTPSQLRPIAILFMPIRLAGIVLSRLISIIDSWAVHLIAPLAGVTQAKSFSRYLLLSAYLLPCAFLAWHLPAPFGLLPVGWAFIISLSVARRWAWTESDREIALRNPDYDETSLRVGLSEDLRDEALLALLSLIILLPLAMRQFHYWYGGDVFVFQESAQDNLLTWIEFFGVELAKAVPFVDWADIYGVESNASISVSTPIASHVVFVARAIVDLIFLAALLQAITISMRWAKHKKMFFDKEIDRLDVMIEKLEFEKLATKKNGEWCYSEQLIKFEHYNEISLGRLRLTNSTASTIWAAATEIMRRRNISTATTAEQFLAFVFEKRPDVVAVNVAFSRSEQANDLDIVTLVSTLKKLNWKAPFNGLREKLVSAIINLPPSPERTTSLRNILTGPDSDSIAPVRALAIPALQMAAREDARATTALLRAAWRDKSRTIVKPLAQQALDELGINWKEERLANSPVSNIQTKPEDELV